MIKEISSNKNMNSYRKEKKKKLANPEIIHQGEHGEPFKNAQGMPKNASLTLSSNVKIHCTLFLHDFLQDMCQTLFGSRLKIVPEDFGEKRCEDTLQFK